jgi:hypothetical protein
MRVGWSKGVLVPHTDLPPTPVAAIYLQETTTTAL